MGERDVRARDVRVDARRESGHDPQEAQGTPGNGASLGSEQIPTDDVGQRALAGGGPRDAD